jgi:hypothetical protein
MKLLKIKVIKRKENSVIATVKIKGTIKEFEFSNEEIERDFISTGNNFYKMKKEVQEKNEERMKDLNELVTLLLMAKGSEGSAEPIKHMAMAGSFGGAMTDYCSKYEISLIEGMEELKIVYNAFLESSINNGIGFGPSHKIPKHLKIKIIIIGIKKKHGKRIIKFK